MIGVDQDFPDWHSLTGVASNNEMVTVEFKPNYHWKVIYFYPKDFTFICPTEIAAFDELSSAAQIIGVSGDNEFCKLAWKQDSDLIRDIDHTLAADSGMALGYELGIVSEEEGVHYRATYIIDPNNIVQHVSINALDTGRSAKEIHRTLAALQAGGLTGCSWQLGDDFVA